MLYYKPKDTEDLFERLRSTNCFLSEIREVDFKKFYNEEIIYFIIKNCSNQIVKYFPNVCKDFDDDLLIDIILSNPGNIKFLDDERLKDEDFLAKLIQLASDDDLENRKRHSLIGSGKLISIFKILNNSYPKSIGLMAISYNPAVYGYLNMTFEETIAVEAVMRNALNALLFNLGISDETLNPKLLTQHFGHGPLRFLSGDDRTKKKVKIFKNSPESLALNINAFRLGELSTKDATLLVSKFPLFLESLPSRLKTKRVCETAVFANPRAILFSSKITEAISLRVLTSDDDHAKKYLEKLSNKFKRG